MSIKLRDKPQLFSVLIGALCLGGFFLCLSFLDLLENHVSAAQDGMSFRLRVDVDLVTIEVVVLDKKGNPVRNLKKENFRLYEDGKEQEILSFDEVSGESGPALSANLVNPDAGEPVRGKTVLILFDDSTISPGNIKSSRMSAAGFVHKHMRPQDLIAVASFGMSLKVLQNFTRDREKILGVIDKPAISSAEMTNRPERPIEQMRRAQQLLGQQETMDPTMAMYLKNRSENLLRALNILSKSIKRIKGQKYILIYSESSYYSESLRDIYMDTLESAKRANVVFYTVDPGGLTSGTISELRDLTTRRKSSSTSVSDGFFQTFLSVTIGRGATNRNLLATAMFQVSGSGQTEGDNSGSTDSEPGGSNSGDGDGNPGASNSPPGNNNSNANNPIGSSPGGTWLPDFYDPYRSEQNLLRSLSDETGGWAIFNTNDYDSELEKLDRQLSNYYILGFQSDNPKRDGSFRKLKVKTDLEGLTLKHRKGYVDPRPLDTLAGSKREESLLDAVASPTLYNRLPLVFRPIYFYDASRLAKVVVSAKIDMEKFQFKKKGKELRGNLNIMGVAYAGDGSVSARFSETLNLSFDKEKEKELRKTGLAYRNYFRLRPGKYRLKLAVSDQADNLGSTEQFLELPPLPESQLAGSSLVIPEHISALPILIQNIQTNLLDDSDPLIYAGMQIQPSVENRLPAEAPFPVFFKIYNLPDGSVPLSLMVQARLINDKGEEQVLPWTPLDKNVIRTGRSEAAIGFELNFPNQTPGRYTLVIETLKANTSQAAIIQTELDIVKN